MRTAAETRPSLDQRLLDAAERTPDRIVQTIVSFDDLRPIRDANVEFGASVRIASWFHCFRGAYSDYVGGYLLPVGWWAQVAATRDTVSVDAAERGDLLQSASAFWDNPLQRISHLAVAVVDRDIQPGCAIRFEPSMPRPTARTTIRAYTLFGAALDAVIVECDGSVHVMDMKS
jgi:hypothetical protein